MIQPNCKTWLDAVVHCKESGISFVLVTVIHVEGSTPRGLGTKMVVTEHTTFDTIGGGNLEHSVTRNARELLNNNISMPQKQSFPLSSRLGQCCGGHVGVLLEPTLVNATTIAVFGAGHVAKSLVPILSQLNVKIKWIDQRKEEFPIEVPSNVEKWVTDFPTDSLVDLPDHCLALVLTHNHQLDFDLVLSAIKQERFGFIGMIGSNTKAKRFKYKLKQRGLSEELINQLVSPVGNLDIKGKKPVEVAVSISAQIINLLNSDTAYKHSQHEESLAGELVTIK